MLERRASSYIDRSLTAHLYISSRLSHILLSPSFHFLNFYAPEGDRWKNFVFRSPNYSFRPMTRLSRDDRLLHPNHSDGCLTRFGLKAFFSNLIHSFRASNFAPLPLLHSSSNISNSLESFSLEIIIANPMGPSVDIRFQSIPPVPQTWLHRRKWRPKLPLLEYLLLVGVRPARYFEMGW